MSRQRSRRPLRRASWTRARDAVGRRLIARGAPWSPMRPCGSAPCTSGPPVPRTMAVMTPPTDRLPFTGDDDADRLLVAEPLALLIGFALDQQVTVQKAFSGPAELQRRSAISTPPGIAAMDPASSTRLPDAPRPPPFPGRHGRQGPAARRRDRDRLRQRRRADLDRRGRRRRPQATPAGPARVSAR